MSKKLTAGKLFGAIFCIAAALAACVLLWANAYFGGQMKLIDKYLTALERDDFEGYKACIAGGEGLSEADFETAKAIREALEDNEEFKAEASFKGREKLGGGRYSVSFDLTVYNETEHEILKNVSRVVVRDGGKWVIEAAS
ncbi:MAG: hypothetical protein J6C96_05285 [Oscillospiraceae bacterium]|nr:hypothetical protein [Oscillospiraceae bacterium]